jgi:hypothetical protein
MKRAAEIYLPGKRLIIRKLAVPNSLLLQESLSDNSCRSKNILFLILNLSI